MRQTHNIADFDEIVNNERNWGRQRNYRHRNHSDPEIYHAAEFAETHTPLEVFEILSGEPAGKLQSTIIDDAKRHGRYRVTQWMCTAANRIIRSGGHPDRRRIYHLYRMLKSEFAHPHMQMARRKTDGSMSYTTLACQPKCTVHFRTFQ